MDGYRVIPKGDDMASQPIESDAPAAQGLRACLAQMLDEATNHGFKFCAVHLRVAILELDDEILSQERKKSRSSKSSGPHVVSIKSRAKSGLKQKQS